MQANHGARPNSHVKRREKRPKHVQLCHIVILSFYCVFSKKAKKCYVTVHRRTIHSSQSSYGTLQRCGQIRRNYDKQARFHNHEQYDQAYHNYDRRLRQDIHRTSGQSYHSYGKQSHLRNHEQDVRACCTCSYLLKDQNSTYQKTVFLGLFSLRINSVENTHTCLICIQKPCDRASCKCSKRVYDRKILRDSPWQDVQQNHSCSRSFVHFHLHLCLHIMIIRNTILRGQLAALWPYSLQLQHCIQFLILT